MRQVELHPGGPIGLWDWREPLVFEPAASNDRLGWVALEAVSFYD